MRRITSMLLSIFASLFVILGFASNANAFPELDQQCSMVGEDTDLISSGTTPREQSFIPLLNRLEMVNMWWSGPGFAGDQDIKTSILNSSKEVIGYSIGAPTFESEGPLIRNAEFSPALELTPGQIYYIQVDVLDGPNNLFWYRSAGECYNRGNATTEGAAQPWDFLFQTYGNMYTAPAATPAPTTPTTTTTTTPSTSSAPSTTTAVTAAAPKTTTSASISVPSNPQAAYDDINKSAFFSWKASTTADIEGYVISRSEDGTTFTDLGAVTKDVTSYSDKNVIEGKTYHYQVRAYKGTIASPTSVVVSVAIPKDVVATADTNTENAKDEGIFTTRNILLLSAGIIVLALVGTLIYLRRKNKTVKSLPEEKHKAE